MLNIVIMMGKLLNGVEAKATDNGGKVSTFTIINTRDVRNKNGRRDSDFFDVVAWDDLAEFISDNFKKGDRIIVVGRLQRRLYVNSDGDRKKQDEIVASKVYFAKEGLEELLR